MLRNINKKTNVTRAKLRTPKSIGTDKPTLRDVRMIDTKEPTKRLAIIQVPTFFVVVIGFDFIG